MFSVYLGYSVPYAATLLLLLQETIRDPGSRAPAALCYTGLSRLVGGAVPKALQHAGSEDIRIHTIFVYEDDPKLGKVAAQLEALHATGSLHATPVVIAVPCAEAYVGAGGRTACPLDSEDEEAETDFKFRMTSLQNRMVRKALFRGEGIVALTLYTGPKNTPHVRY